MVGRGWWVRCVYIGGVVGGKVRCVVVVGGRRRQGGKIAALGPRLLMCKKHGESVIKAPPRS